MMIGIQPRKGSLMEQWMRAKAEGHLIIEERMMLCPFCGKWSNSEFLQIEEAFQEYPDPRKEGNIMTLACGTCLAKAYLWWGKSSTPFIGEAEKVAAQARYDQNKDKKWVKARIIGPWDGQRVLHEARIEERDRYVKTIRRMGGFNVPSELQEEWGWKDPAAARTIQMITKAKKNEKKEERW